jgi:hypothetical protein
LPSEAIVTEQIQFQMIKDDPSKYYEIVEKIGMGGFAKVFKV